MRCHPSGREQETLDACIGVILHYHGVAAL